MKYLILLMLPFIAFAGVMGPPQSVHIASTGAASNVQVSATSIEVRAFKLWSDNGNGADDVCIGGVAVNGTGSICIDADVVLDFPYIEGMRYDLSDFYLHFVGAGDSGVILYW